MQIIHIERTLLEKDYFYLQILFVDDAGERKRRAFKGNLEECKAAKAYFMEHGDFPPNAAAPGAAPG
jgi:hypothetical protein